MGGLQVHCSLEDIYIDKEDLVDFRDGKFASLQPWANPAKHYAPELTLMVELHKAIRIDGYDHEKKTMQQKVENWLAEHRPNSTFPDYQVKRIATVIGNGKMQARAKKKP